MCSEVTKASLKIFCMSMDRKMPSQPTLGFNIVPYGINF